MNEQQLNLETIHDRPHRNTKPLLPLLLSHCLFPLIVFLIIFISVFLLVFLHKDGPFTSIDEDLNYSILPNYLVQVSDLHFNHHCLDDAQLKHQLFTNIKENLYPHILLFIGDVVHSSNSSSETVYHKNVEENWILFNQTFANSGLMTLPNLSIIAAAGNHDEFAVPVDDMEHHPFRKYFIGNNERPFIVYSSQMNSTIGSLPFNFVTFNPIHPPAPTGPMNISPFIPNEMIEELEKSIRSDHLNILVTHFPLLSFWSDKDSSGKGIRNAVKQYDLMASGHLHSKEPLAYRTEGILNGISAQAITNFMNTTVYTIDNNMPSLHNIDITKGNRLLITYPIASNSITSKTIFNKESFDVRAIFLSPNKEAKIQVTIDGEYYGAMSYVSEIKENAQFFSLPVRHVKEGNHILTVSAPEYDSEYTIEFYVGEVYESRRYSWDVELWSYHPQLNMGLAVFSALYCILRLIPLWLIPSVKEIIEKFENHLQDPLQNTLTLRQLFSYSIIDYLTRYRKLSLLTYCLLIFCSAWIFVVPVYITPIDYKMGIIFVWGVVIDGKVSFHSFNFLVWTLYNVLFLLPSGSFSAFMNREFQFFWESAVYALEMITVLIASIIIGNVLGEVVSIFGSPLPYVIILSYAIIIYDIIYQNRRNYDMLEPDGNENNEETTEKENPEENVL